MIPKREEYQHQETSINTNAACWFVRLDDNKSHKKNKAGPCRRWGHSSEILDNKLIVYGGTGYTTNPRHWDSVYQLDLDNWDWTKLDPTNKSPQSRDSHSCVIYQKKLYIFGGSNGSDSKNDMLEYDLTTNQWRTLDVRGNIPSPREGHSACLFDERYIVIYGGWNGEETFNDCYLFDIPQRNWISITKKIGMEPSPRESQSCCMLRNCMYLFGGQGNNIQREGQNFDNFCNDLHKLQITFEGNQVIATWTKLEITGPKPSKRSSHAACKYLDRYMIVVGGEGYPPGFDEENKAHEYKKQQEGDDGEKEYPCYPKNDVWFFDVETSQWFEVKAKNDKEFIPRFAHSCHNFKNNILVFGGLQDYHNSTNDICVLSIDGVNPFGPNSGFIPRVSLRERQISESNYLQDEPDPNYGRVDRRKSISEYPMTDTTIKVERLERIDRSDKGEIIEKIERSERSSLTRERSLPEEMPEIRERGISEKRDERFVGIENGNNRMIEENYNNRLASRPKRQVPERFNPITPTHHVIHPEVKPEAQEHHTSFPVKAGPLVSLSFLNALSSIMSWPLAAFGLLLDNALINHSKIFRINYHIKSRTEAKKATLSKPESTGEEKTEKQEESEGITCIQFEDDGFGWKNEDFIRVIMNYDMDWNEEGKSEDVSAQGEQLQNGDQLKSLFESARRKLNEYAFNLKIAGFRLGKSIIYVSKNEDEVSIAFLSADKRFNPNVHKNHVFFYTQRFGTGELLSNNAFKHKAIIFNALKGILSEEELLKDFDKISNRIIILDLNPVSVRKSNGVKGTDFELILKKDTSESPSDIVVRTLDSSLSGTSKSSSFPFIELSLKTYFNHFLLDSSKVQLQVFLNETHLEFNNVKQTIEQNNASLKSVKFAEQGLFEGVLVKGSLPPSQPQNEQSDMTIEQQEVSKTNTEKSGFDQGVLIYYKNRLIRRLENPKLGNLDFLSYQYKMMHGNANEIFDINGYIELKGYFKPNIFKTEIENPYYSNYLYSLMRTHLDELKSINGKRRNELLDTEAEETMKKVKT